jgi:fatty-acyl-CoA synthase
MSRLTESYWPAQQEGEFANMTVGRMMEDLAERLPNHRALVYSVPGETDRIWTYAELVRDAKEVARALLARFSPGDRIAIWGPNSAEWLLVQHGAAFAGIVLVTLNPAYVAPELEYVLRQSRAVGLIHAQEVRGVRLGEVAASVADRLPELRERISLADWDLFIADADPATSLPDVSPDDPALIQYTSGTTGAAKGVLLHHRGVVNSARFVAQRVGMPEGVVSVSPMPLFHIGGCGTMELGTMSRGGTLVMVPGFDPGQVLELVERFHADVTFAVPTMLLGLLEHPDLARRDLSSLTTVMSGGASVPAELVRRVKDLLGSAFTISYGQTETCGPAYQSAPTDGLVEQVETVGRALPFTESKIVDPDTGEIVSLGVQGEVCARGDQTMLGYFEMPDATRVAIDDGGWLHSGDLGTMDENGFIRITGRIKDMIIRGGENVYPLEVENVLYGHAGVADISVIGIPDEKWGERVVGIVRPADPAAPPAPEELAAFASQKLARFKVPVEWHFVDGFPLTASGKIQKFILRDQFRRDN